MVGGVSASDRLCGQVGVPRRISELLEWSRQPWVIVVNVISLLLVGFHAVTWFNLAPQALVVHLGHTQVPGSVIAASNYAAWVVVSAIVAWILAAGLR